VGATTGAVYVLRSVAGQPLPAPLLATEYATLTAVADTIRLGDNGAGKQVVVQRARDAGQPAPGELYRVEEPFTYEVIGTRIAISLECNDVIIRQCVAPPHYTGTVTSGTMVLETALQYRTPLRYERVRVSSDEFFGLTALSP
jgi:hypothetical protein